MWALAKGRTLLLGADIVNVAPAYGHAEVTAIAATDLVHYPLVMMIVAASDKSAFEREQRCQRRAVKGNAKHTNNVHVYSSSSTISIGHAYP